MKFTINSFNDKYPDDDICLDEIFKARYGSIKKCPKCQKETKFNRIKMRKCYCCEFCGFQLHPVANTIFHKSDTSLRNWFYAIFLFSTSKNGVSAKELERQLGVTYKCAWRMARQIRLLFEQNKEALKNIVEIDETYWGGVSKGLKAKEYKDRGTRYKRSSKKAILGMVERGGDIKAKVIINAKDS